VFWLLVAYLVLPRLHRALTYIYVPNYFIGRTRTSDGLLGDPVNLALLGSEAQVHRAMTTAGWTRAEEVTLASSLRIVKTTLTRRSYPKAPVSPLHLFERQQDFAYQQEVASNPAQRHHVRFWRCPQGWHLPGGYTVDWVAAGTYDRSVGLSLMTFQVTHRIARDIDVERDYIVASVIDAEPAVSVDTIRNFASGYHARNGGGDQMVTDGDLPVLDLRGVEAREEPLLVRPTDSRDKPPAPITFAVGASCLRGLVGVVVAALLLGAPQSTSFFETDPTTAARVAAASVFIVSAVLDVGLGLATFHGRNWARVLLMLSCTASVTAAFGATLVGAPRPTLGTSLPQLGLGILILLALTSPAARVYALRRSHGSCPGAESAVAAT
jgi:hypothetical protein